VDYGREIERLRADLPRRCNAVPVPPPALPRWSMATSVRRSCRARSTARTNSTGMATAHHRPTNTRSARHRRAKPGQAHQVSGRRVAHPGANRADLVVLVV